ncbi:unnamed protein product [Clonostachys byssicola]|uniref:Uncharacterized protein n=1 Tax=Clonostachys byssicola TaxID=160290 RepID=A0A9N9Y634_9HYPO|nr:unnamed protein product [Clonostachys byssicola]
MTYLPGILFPSRAWAGAENIVFCLWRLQAPAGGAMTLLIAEKGKSRVWSFPVGGVSVTTNLAVQVLEPKQSQTGLNA